MKRDRHLNYWGSQISHQTSNLSSKIKIHRNFRHNGAKHAVEIAFCTTLSHIFCHTRFNEVKICFSACQHWRITIMIFRMLFQPLFEKEVAQWSAIGQVQYFCYSNTCPKCFCFFVSTAQWHNKVAMGKKLLLVWASLLYETWVENYWIELRVR